MVTIESIIQIDNDTNGGASVVEYGWGDKYTINDRRMKYYSTLKL